MIRLSNINIKGAGDWHRNGLVLRKRCEPYINNPENPYFGNCRLVFTGTQSFVLAAFATLVCQRNCVFLCKGTKLKNSACTEFLDSYAGFLWHRALVLLLLKKQANSTFCKVVKQKGEAFWHRNTLNLCNCRVPKLQKAALFAIVCRFFVAQSFVLAPKYPILVQVS